MLTTPPTLYVRRPSPTTAEFTVTTCPPLTLPLRLLLAALNLLRGIIALAAAALFYKRFLEDGPFIFSFSLPFGLGARHVTRKAQQAAGRGTDGSGIGYLIQLIITYLLQAASLLDSLASPFPSWAVASVCVLALHISLFTRLHTTESVLVLRGLGMQISSSPGAARSPYLGSSSGGGAAGFFGFRLFGPWPWRTERRFIPTEQIRDVLINEAFRGFEVRYCLIVVVEGEEDVTVLFPGLLPRRKIVERVWRGVRECLWEGEEGRGMTGKESLKER